MCVECLYIDMAKQDDSQEMCLYNEGFEEQEMKYICVYIAGIHEMRSERDEC